MNVLQHRAAQASADLDNARTPAQKRDARAAGFAVHADLAKHIADDKAMAAFKAVQPKSMAGVYADNTVRDAPVFMTAAAEARIVGPVKLPNGSLATPNPQGQIVVPASMVPAMIARGYFRANSVITGLGDKFPMSDPPIPNHRRRFIPRRDRADQELRRDGQRYRRHHSAAQQDRR